MLEFRDLISSTPVDVSTPANEARFSFFRGGYVEDSDLQGKFNLLTVFFGLLLAISNVKENKCNRN